MDPYKRRARMAELTDLRARIDAEILAIEEEILAEIEANRRAKDAARRASVKVSRRPAAHCGTEGGYYRHLRTLREEACDACKLAHKVAESERRARRHSVDLAAVREAS